MADLDPTEYLLGLLADVRDRKVLEREDDCAPYLDVPGEEHRPRPRSPGTRCAVMPNPGSKAAIEQGCICPVLDNNHGQWPPYPPDGWWKRPDCPLHFPAKEAP